MPAFLKSVFRREHSKKNLAQAPVPVESKEPKYVDGWLRTNVVPEEVQELLRGCTREVKSRGLSMPFLLLPYRPNTDPSAARTLIRNFFNPTNGPLTGARLEQELRLTEPEVLCSALKWCWSRLPGGVVTWDVYELFRQGEVDSSMARDSFATFIPISAESEARSKIIFDYFDLLSAIAAHGKHNGLGGLKLSRLAGWWAFEHTDTGYGFEGGYTLWKAAADATCHLFFAYLRSLSPADPSRDVIRLPNSLKALLASVDYPPVTPQQLQNRSVKVVITVDKVSPSPFGLLRRAKHLPYNPNDQALKVFTDYEDPVKALTDECRRVLKCISSTGHSSSGGYKASTGLQEQSWSRFQDIGFAASAESSDSEEDALQSETFKKRLSSQQNRSLSAPAKEDCLDIVRPQTPSWADFMDSGFGDRGIDPSPAHHLLPPDKVLPPIATNERLKTAQSSRRGDLEPGELENITPMEVDDAFWWVWMSSLAGEETASRKAVFGRCALAETTVKGVKWLVVEEKIRGAAILEEAPLVTRKDKKWTTKRGRLRRKSLPISEAPAQLQQKPFNPALYSGSRTNIGPHQTAKIQAAAAALRKQQTDSDYMMRRVNQHANSRESQSTNIFTLQPVIMTEATPAMKWASRYDRDTQRGRPAPPPPEKPMLVIEKPTAERALPALPKEIVQRHKESSIPAPIASNPTPRSTIASIVPAHAPAPAPAISPSPFEADQQSMPASPTANGQLSPVSDKRASMTPSPDTSNGSLPDKSKKVSRLRAMFVKKADGTGASVSGGTQLGVPAEAPGRRLSMRRKAPPVRPPMAAPRVPELERKPPPPGFQRPMAKQYMVKETAPQPQAPPTFVSSLQGPLEDQPSFAPDDSSEVSELEPEPASQTKDDDELSEVVPVAPPAITMDRWAQIRKNAAAQKAKTQSKTPDDASATNTTARESLDDGETSGEETIESRVARIKARVAQLTADGNAGRI